MQDTKFLSSDKIQEARAIIDPAFLNSPLSVSAELNLALGLELFIKDETKNLIRSFKGRGTSLFVRRDVAAGVPLITASAGNFGQGVAHNGIHGGHRVTVFASESANRVKVDAMRHLGAEVIQRGRDFDDAKTFARESAKKTGGYFIEDGALPAIAEGAGTIAAELTDAVPELDAIFIPIGNGALATGVGCWIKAVSPQTRVIAVAAARAPCMLLSWQKGSLISTDAADTVADGIAVRIPVPFALDSMADTIDEVMLVTDEEILASMAVLSSRTGMVVEPAGAAGFAGLLKRNLEFAGRRVATIACGANLTAEQMASWFPNGNALKSSINKCV